MDRTASLPLRATIATALVVGLAGCAAQSDTYPSLAPRPIEQLSLTEPSRPRPQPAEIGRAHV